MSQGYLHTLGLIALFYWFTGALLWMLMDGLGITGRTYDKRLAEGKAPSFAVLAIAIVLAIVLWPKVAAKLLENPRKAGAMLARILGVRP